MRDEDGVDGRDMSCLPCHLKETWRVAFLDHINRDKDVVQEGF